MAAFTQICLLIMVVCLLGCAYTVIRDLDEEARQAEWAIVDTLTLAPDLTISDLDFEYIHRELPTHVSPGLGRGGSQVRPSVRFYLTVANEGTADFVNTYLLVCRAFTSAWFGPREDVVQVSLLNKEGDTIPAGGRKEIVLPLELEPDSALYVFTIVTNPILQGDFLDEVGRYHRRTPVPPLSRELRYDNNEAEAMVAGYGRKLYREGW